MQTRQPTPPHILTALDAPLDRPPPHRATHEGRRQPGGIAGFYWKLDRTTFIRDTAQIGATKRLVRDAIARAFCKKVAAGHVSRDIAISHFRRACVGDAHERRSYRGKQKVEHCRPSCLRIFTYRNCNIWGGGSSSEPHFLPGSSMRVHFPPTQSSGPTPLKGGSAGRSLARHGAFG
jgi:hypothetical protein